MILPDDQDLRDELLRLSHMLYGVLEMGGELGPSIEQYNEHRLGTYCQAQSLLKVYGLSGRRAGWVWVLGSFGLLHPTRLQMKLARAYQRSSPFAPIQWPDEEYPTLRGTVRRATHDSILPDGTRLRTTKFVISLR